MTLGETGHTGAGDGRRHGDQGGGDRGIIRRRELVSVDERKGGRQQERERK